MGVGVLVHAHVGDSVESGQRLFTLFHAEKGLGASMIELGRAISWRGRE